jgi:hypothetical protein
VVERNSGQPKKSPRIRELVRILIAAGSVWLVFWIFGRFVAPSFGEGFPDAIIAAGDVIVVIIILVMAWRDAIRAKSGLG